MKNLVSIILSVLIIFSSLSFVTVSAEETNISSVNILANNSSIQWDFDKGTGTLTISGKGKMPNYTYQKGSNNSVKTNIPWYNVATGVKKLIIEEGITSIGENAFCVCKNLSSITFPISVTNIGWDCFNGCKNVKSIYYSGTERKIRDLILDNYNLDIIDTTYYCTGEVDTGTIGKCKWTFYIKTGKIVFSGTGSTGDGEELDMVPWSCYTSQIKSVEFGKGITKIGDYVLGDCKNITSVTIPDNVTKIGNGAFINCTSLKNVTIPNKVTSIGYSAFENCTNLQSVKVPNSITTFKDKTFENCTKLSKVNMPSKLKSVCDEAFYGCISLQAITLPKSLTYIGDEAFKNCSKVKNFNLQSSTNHIGKDAFLNSGFYNNSKNWENNILYIGNYLVATNKNVSISKIKNTTTLIADGAFYGRPILSSIVIPKNVKKIGPSTFEGCTSLKKVTIENGILSIGKQAFVNCKTLTNVTMGNSIKSIGESAFENCTSLNNIKLPNKPIKIYSSAFDNTKYMNDKKNWKNGALYIGKALIKVKENQKNLNIRKGTNTIAESAFEIENNTKAIVIPSSLVTIPQEAFAGLTNLTKVTLSVGIKVIGVNAFTSCEKLKSIIIPKTVNKICNRAFLGCDSLKSIVLPTSVKVIGEDVFDEDNLNVYYTGTKKQYNSIKCPNALDEFHKITYNYGKLKLNKNTLSLKKGKSAKLKAIASPSTALSYRINWSTTNKKIATVSSKGKVTAKGKGTCYIYAKVKNNSKKFAKCKISVK